MTMPMEPAPETSTEGPDRAGRRRLPAAPRSLPSFVTDLLADRTAMRTLLVASAAVAAVGLDPHILDPGMPAMRTALARDPQLQGWFLLAAVLQSGFILLGGFLADAFRSVRLLRFALVLLALASLVEALTRDDSTLYLLRIVAWACDGIILPFAIGAVAVSTAGPNRATALGVAYAVFGAASAAAPALALVLGQWGVAWPAFLTCGLMAIVALVVSPALPARPAAGRVGRRGMAIITLFAFGVVSFAGSVIGITADGQLIRTGGMLIGVAAMVAAILLRVADRGPDAPRIALRPVTVALGAGVVIGFAQAAPIDHLPIFFERVQGLPQLLAMAGIAPFVIALLVAGPLSGYLLERFRPRTLIAGGLVAVGVANLILWLALSPSMPYAIAIVPFVLIGAGFVVGTTVRTAVIFANMPRGMPSMAAGFNEASIGVGVRLGVMVATTVMTQVALAAITVPTQGGMVAAQPGIAIATIRELTMRIGIPSLGDLAAGLDPVTVSRAFEAVVGGMRTTELVLGVAALTTGAIAWLLLGKVDPVGSVWELADERGEGSERPSTATGSATPAG